MIRTKIMSTSSGGCAMLTALYIHCTIFTIIVNCICACCFVQIAQK